MVGSSEILNASILVVDDQEVNVLLLEQMLRSAGYTSVASTRDPREVCELQRTHRYCLILLDLQMPGMDGFQVMEGLKEIEDDYLPVLVITAQPGPSGCHPGIGAVRLANVQPPVVALLEIIRLHRVFSRYPSVEQAVQSFA